MNRTTIEWATHTLNLVTGCTLGCPWCYARPIAHRLKGRAGYPQEDPFKPTIHWNRIYQVPDKGAHRRIFVDSMGEFFDPTLKSKDIQTLLDYLSFHHDDSFLILTKLPQRAITFRFPENVWLGASITEPADVWRVFLFNAGLQHRFVSIEPLLRPVSQFLPGPLHAYVQWVIIGGLSGQASYVPPFADIDRIIKQCHAERLPVFVKDNARLANPPREYPPELEVAPPA
jgi:protein gp37